MTPGTFPPEEKYEPSIATNNTMSTRKTPRTDAEVYTVLCGSLNGDRLEEREVVDPDFTRQLETELAAAKADTEQLRGLLLRVTGSLGLVIGGAKPTAWGHKENFDKASKEINSWPDPECDGHAKPAPASPEGLREAVVAALSQGRSLSLYSQKAELILTAIAPFVGDGKYREGLRELVASWKKRVAELEKNSDFHAHGQDEFSMDHGERNGIDSCIDDIQAFLFSAQPATKE